MHINKWKRRNNMTETAGLGVSTLTIIFIVLKLFGAVNWPWIWVLCPLWLGFVLSILIFVPMLIFSKICDMTQKH